MHTIKLVTRVIMAAPFRFRSILVSLNAVHRFQVHTNRFRFCLNGNITVFMPPTVVYVIITGR